MGDERTAADDAAIAASRELLQEAREAARAADRAAAQAASAAAVAAAAATTSSAAASSSSAAAPPVLPSVPAAASPAAAPAAAKAGPINAQAKTKEDAYNNMQELLQSRLGMRFGGAAAKAPAPAPAAPAAEAAPLDIRSWMEGDGARREPEEVLVERSPQEPSRSSAAAAAAAGPRPPQQAPPSRPQPAAQPQGSAGGSGGGSSNSGDRLSRALEGQSSGRPAAASSENGDRPAGPPAQPTAAAGPASASSPSEKQQQQPQPGGRPDPWVDESSAAPSTGPAVTEQTEGGQAAPAAAEASAGAEGAAVQQDRGAQVAALVQSGLSALRRGREAAQRQQAWAEADVEFAKAASTFAMAADLDPECVQAFGNGGNALLAHGRLKLQASSAAAARPGGGVDAEAALLAQAEDLFVQAGRQFRQVLLRAPGDARALSNWGAALSLRGRLMASEQPRDAEMLFEAAAEKYAAAAKAQPGAPGVFTVRCPALGPLIVPFCVVSCCRMTGVFSLVLTVHACASLSFPSAGVGTRPAGSGAHDAGGQRRGKGGAHVRVTSSALAFVTLSIPF